MSVEPLIFYVGRELPSRDLWCLDSLGAPIDFTGATWTMPSSVVLRVGAVDTTVNAVVTALASPSGDGESSADAPCVNVAPAVGSLNTVPTGIGVLIVVIVHTATGKGREFQYLAEVRT